MSLKKLNEMTLCMQIIDYDRFSHDDTIGEVLLPLKDIKLDRKPCYWKHLQPATVTHKVLERRNDSLENFFHKSHSRRSNTVSVTFIFQTVKGEIMLSVCYLPESDRLTVVVIKAKDLPAKDMSGSSGIINESNFRYN